MFRNTRIIGYKLWEAKHFRDDEAVARVKIGQQMLVLGVTGWYLVRVLGRYMEAPVIS